MQDLKSLILPHLDELNRVARSLCRDPDLAEEMVADTVARACESIHRLRDHSRAKAWLMRILGNVFINDRRMRQRHPLVSLDLLDHDEQRFSVFEHLEQAGPITTTPEEEFTRHVLDQDIQDALASIPANFRLAVALCDVEGYTYGEIARILSVPVGTVRSRIARGRSILQKRLWIHMKDLGYAKPPAINAKVNKPNGASKETCNCEANKL